MVYTFYPHYGILQKWCFNLFTMVTPIIKDSVWCSRLIRYCLCIVYEFWVSNRTYTRLISALLKIINILRCYKTSLAYRAIQLQSSYSLKSSNLLYLVGFAHVADSQQLQNAWNSSTWWKWLFVLADSAWWRLWFSLYVVIYFCLSKSY